MYNTSANYDISGISNLIQVMGIGFYAILIGYCILTIAAMWKLFNDFKEDGWKSLIPIYNNYILYKHSELNPNLVFLVFIPCVGSLIIYILNIKAILNLKNKMSGKAKGGFVFLTVILQPIALALLAFNEKKTEVEKTATAYEEEEDKTAQPAPIDNSVVAAPIIDQQPSAIPTVEASTVATPEVETQAIPEAPVFDTMPTPVEPQVTPEIPQQPEIEQQQPIGMPETPVADEVSTVQPIVQEQNDQANQD